MDLGAVCSGNVVVVGVVDEGLPHVQIYLMCI